MSEKISVVSEGAAVSRRHMSVMTAADSPLFAEPECVFFGWALRNTSTHCMLTF